MAPLWFDSGWPPPPSALTGYAGFLFYLAPGDNRRPDPTVAQLQAYLDAGLDLAVIWQAGKVDIAAGGFALGVQHATAANADADVKGVGWWEPIIYACDDNKTFAQVESYYRGVQSVYGRPVGAYGGSYLIADLHDRLGIRWFMQAAARSWSAPNNFVSQYAQFWQRDPNVPVGNSAVDQVVPLAPYPTRRTGPLMAAPLTTDQLLATLKKWLTPASVPLVEYRGWRDRCRCHTGSHEKGVGPRKQFGPQIGTTVHITAGNLAGRTPQQYIDDILLNDPAVPGKCNFAVIDGTVYLLSAGLCNHMLYLSSRAKVALENGTLSLTAYDDQRGDDYGKTGTVAGSTFLLGIENVSADSLGNHPDNYRASQLICAAVSDAHGWDGSDAIGHGEGAIDRTYADPGINMGAFRAGVKALVAAGPPRGGQQSNGDGSVVVSPDLVQEASTMKIIAAGPAVDSPANARGMALVTENGATLLKDEEERYAVNRIMTAKPGEYVLFTELDLYTGAVKRARS